MACARDKSPLPARIANAPELLPGLELFYSAFLDLTTCREQGYGMEGPISWLKIDDYASRCGYEGEQREDLFFFVMRMDAAYAEHRAKKASKAATPEPKRKR